MADMAALVMRNALAANGGDRGMENIGGADAGPDHGNGHIEADGDGAMILLELLARFAEHAVAGNVGAVVAIAAADIEPDHVTLHELLFGRLHVGHGAAGTDTDAAQHRQAALVDG